jgi:hypothetical protein
MTINPQMTPATGLFRSLKAKTTAVVTQLTALLELPSNGPTALDLNQASKKEEIQSKNQKKLENPGGSGTSSLGVRAGLPALARRRSTLVASKNPPRRVTWGCTERSNVLHRSSYRAK